MHVVVSQTSLTVKLRNWQQKSKSISFFARDSPQLQSNNIPVYFLNNYIVSKLYQKQYSLKWMNYINLSQINYAVWI